MLTTLGTIILAGLALGFLIFIHEWGHFIVARSVGMKVEVFSIGFGKPFYSWVHKGVKWQICPFLLGGYVKIAGTEPQGKRSVYDVPNGFFGRPPIDRIKVALAGPFINLIFGFLAFCLLFVLGGREKPFQEYTHIIGVMDPQSALYEKGVRPGDELNSLDNHPYSGVYSLIQAAVMDKSTIEVSGKKVDYFTKETAPFSYEVKPYESEALFMRGMRTIGILTPANMLIYDKWPDGSENELRKHSPVASSGLEYGDRILWANGEIIFSHPQLRTIINDNTAYLTIQRADQTLHAKVPRIPVRYLSLSKTQDNELQDWQYETKSKQNYKDQLFIPYDLDSHLIVEKSISYVDDNFKKVDVPQEVRNPLYAPLQKGDKILAIDGEEIFSGVELLEKLQTPKVQLIVKRQAQLPKLTWKDQDEYFINSVDWKGLETIASSIGTIKPVQSVGDLALLASITPTKRMEFPRSFERQTKLEQAIDAYQKQVEKISDPAQKEAQLKALEKFKNSLFLGIPLQDYTVSYNPYPWTLFAQTCMNISRTLDGLVSGTISPKWMSGPIGIVYAMQQQANTSIKEGIFWLGMISINLGIFNLLPLPVLDGGHILFSVWEMITRRRLNLKMMERITIPFVILFIFLFIFISSHDILHIFAR